MVCDQRLYTDLLKKGRAWDRETSTNVTINMATKLNQAAGKRKGPKNVEIMLPQVNAGMISL